MRRRALVRARHHCRFRTNLTPVVPALIPSTRAFGSVGGRVVGSPSSSRRASASSGSGKGCPLIASSSPRAKERGETRGRRFTAGGGAGGGPGGGGEREKNARRGDPPGRAPAG